MEEIVFGSRDSARSTAISRDVRAGRLRRLAPKVYTSNLSDSPDAVVRRNLYRILGHLYSGAVISHRSALEGGLADGTIFLSYKYTRRVELAGVTVRLLKGPGPLEGDTPFMDGLHFASRARAVLENLRPSRARSGVPKGWPSERIEGLLDDIARIHGPDELNRLRDQARRIAPALGAEEAFRNLDGLVGTLLGTRTAELKAPAARARAAGIPYDTHCLARCVALVEALQRSVLPVRTAPALTADGLRNLAFFDAYFSNYIEGTEFLVEEAAEIAFNGRIIAQRPADSHDILGTFRLLADETELPRMPETGDAFIEQLLRRHEVLLAGRPERRPGRFKERPNRAGDTVFVAPELVRGTLLKAFEPYASLADPLARAMYLKFVVSDVHPFEDGNGRLARVMMNAALAAGGRVRILIPTIYRDDYLLALRALTRQSRTEPYLGMLDRAQAFTAGIDFSRYDLALAQLRAANAFSDPHEAQLRL